MRSVGSITLCSKSEVMLLFLLRHQKAFSLQVIFRHVVKRSFFVTKWSKAETFITNIFAGQAKIMEFYFRRVKGNKDKNKDDKPITYVKCKCQNL